MDAALEQERLDQLETKPEGNPRRSSVGSTEEGSSTTTETLRPVSQQRSTRGIQTRTTSAVKNKVTPRDNRFLGETSLCHYAAVSGAGDLGNGPTALRPRLGTSH